MKAVARTLSSILPKVPVSKLNADGISRDKSLVAHYRTDPLVYIGWMKARWAHEILQAMDSLQAGAASFRTPLLVLQCGQEKTQIDPKGSRRFYDAVGSLEKTYIEYPDYWHELFNEPGKERPMHDLLAFLNACIH